GAAKRITAGAILKDDAVAPVGGRPSGVVVHANVAAGHGAASAGGSLKKDAALGEVIEGQSADSDARICNAEAIPQEGGVGEATDDDFRPIRIGITDVGCLAGAIYHRARPGPGHMAGG